MRQYDHKKIEGKWQKAWMASELYKTSEDSKKPKCYVLDEFPYPSGEGLHTGHTRIYTASDIYARMKRMQGYNVLHPSGWDAFGLPAEQYAIKNKVHPSQSVKKNTERYKEQMTRVGLSYDWDREINTTDPKFYKWTQWIFLKMLEKGLAFESFEPINWCPTCQTGLANEDLEGGKCERCGSVVEKKPMRQWVLRITEYADRLIDDLDTLPEWPDAVKEAQRNWIGRSEGAEIEFGLIGIPGQENGKHKVKVFTTRPDTLFGATYIAISAELAKKWLDVGWQANEEVKNFVATTLEEEKERTFETEVAEKKGVATGVYAINPANQEKIPVWIANYVLSGYGTGAIMAVPAHDERDFEFAQKYGINIVDVVSRQYVLTGEDAEREGIETLHRKVVDPVLRDKEGNFYLIKEAKGNHIHFAGGGVDEGEDDLAALRREIIEETGFTDFEITKKIAPQISCWGYRHTKSKNQRSVGPAYEVVLSSDKRIHSEVEDGHHELVKVKKEDVLKTITWEHHRFIFEQYLNDAVVYAEPGVLINSGKFDGLESEAAKTAITEFVGGKLTKQYRLKDWVFSRQRYWGEPIPVVHCAKDGVVPVPEKDLPVTLPEVESYAPTGTGESPLAEILEWVNTTCPHCDGPAKRETNTMPQWAGSSWYYLRFMDPHNDQALVGKDKEKYWAPVDVYVGGAEHVTRHLIYARFWHKFLYDIGVVSTSEPFKRRRGVGLVLGEGGVKMSKRLGNVINPDDIVDTFGADSLRVYEMFMGPFGNAIAWSTDNLVGARRFIERVWRLQERIAPEATLLSDAERALHEAIKKVGEDIEKFAFNTAISQMMICLNALEKESNISPETFRTLLLILAPFAPHMTEELWSTLGEQGSIHVESWPAYDALKLTADSVTIAIQINGKLRSTMIIPATFSDDEVKDLGQKDPGVTKWLEGKNITRMVYVPKKILNIIIS
jgi:leucyl-tRNA synthetase